MTGITSFERIAVSVNKVLSGIGLVLLFVMMIQGAVDVIGRYLFNLPLIGTMERNQAFLAVIVVFGWGYTQLSKGHVNVDLFLKRLAPRKQAIVNFITTIFGLVIFVLITWQSILTGIQWQQKGRLLYVVDWPIAPFQFCVTLGGIVLCLVLILDLVKLFYEMRQEA